jgi:hypothetical protein
VDDRKLHGDAGAAGAASMKNHCLASHLDQSNGFQAHFSHTLWQTVLVNLPLRGKWSNG